MLKNINIEVFQLRELLTVYYEQTRRVVGKPIGTQLSAGASRMQGYLAHKE